MNGDETLAILVGGGPAPGINGVIASATIEARNHGLRVLGIYEGYRHLVERRHLARHASSTIDDVSRHALLRRLDAAHVAHEPGRGPRVAAPRASVR